MRGRERREARREAGEGRRKKNVRRSEFLSLFFDLTPLPLLFSSRKRTSAPFLSPPRTLTMSDSDSDDVPLLARAAATTAAPPANKAPASSAKAAAAAAAPASNKKKEDGSSSSDDDDAPLAARVKVR